MDLLIALVTFVGVALVVPSYDLADNTLQGVLFGCISGLSLAMISVIGKKYTATYKSTTISFYQNLVATVLMSCIVFFHPTVAMSWESISLLILLGTVFSALPQLLLFQSLSKLKASTVSIILSLESVYGIALALLFLSEIPSGRMLVGGVIILLTSMYASLRKGG